MAWIITKDKIAIEEDKRENPEGKCNLYALGLTGPRGASDSVIQALHRGEGAPFKMYDDDGNLYYKGLYLEDPNAEEEDFEEDFGPLYHFGLPNAGCTHIKYKSKKTGKWEIL